MNFNKLFISLIIIDISEYFIVIKILIAINTVMVA